MRKRERERERERERDGVREEMVVWKCCMERKSGRVQVVVKEWRGDQTMNYVRKNIERGRLRRKREREGDSER